MKIPKNAYNKDFLLIKGFSNITITDLCKKIGKNRSYLMAGNGKDEDYKRLREELESELAKLYIRK